MSRSIHKVTSQSWHLCVIVPKTPHQNKVVVRHKRTLMEMVWNMSSYSDVPLSLWMHALRILVYLLDRVPSKAVPKTLAEPWTGGKPILRHLGRTH
jgi:hypothetical protein